MTTEQKFNCIFCKDTFENKEELQDHFRKHGDPTYKTKTRFESLIPNEKRKEKTEMVSCDVCSQMFTTISKAITHKHKMHPDHDAKYFCQWCGKLFTMKHLYTVHIQTSHNNQVKTDEKCFHCDSCNVDFFLPSAILYHNKFFHRQDTDLPDVGQSKKIKLCNQEVVQIYYCAFCGEEYDNKVNLFKHMTDDHGDENQSPEEVLKCPLCEAVFFHLDAYEVHLTFHTPDDMYSVQNDALGEVLDYSLDTVPPIIEKVESIETEALHQETDPESTINAVGIEKFLELAMDQPDNSPVKVKKHKKHKKSKKAAITLDEFLSMNQDVFGEGLDFQGIEEVPTRVVKNQLKNKKKATNPTNSVTLSDLEKLKNAGIIIKKKEARNPVVNNLKATLSKPTKSNDEKIFKLKPERELKTSSEVLTKLMNQSNTQIKIIKKSSSDNVIQDQHMTEDENIEEGAPPSEETELGKDSEVEPCTSSQTNANTLGKANSANEDHVTDKSSPNSPTPTEKTPEDNLSNKNDSGTHYNDEEDMADINSPSNNEKADDQPAETEIRSSNKEDNIENEVSPKAIAEETNKNESEHEFSDTELDDKPDAFDSTENHEDDVNGDDNQEINDNNEQSNISKPAGASLSRLQHLSHLITVKPVNQSKITTPVERDKNTQIPNPKITSQLIYPSENVNISKPKVQAEKDPTVDALKNLSKNITIKSLSTKRSVHETEVETNQFDEVEGKNNTIDKNLMIKKIKVENDETVDKKIVNSYNSPGKALVNKSAVAMKPNRIMVDNAGNSVQSSNANILKRLTNITSKPISKKRVNNNPQPVKQLCVAKKVVQAEKKPEEIIEIFDVDDSEDELENSSSKVEPSQNSVTSMDALKNLSKNITIKSNKQQPMTKNMKLVNDIKIEKQNEDSSNNYKDDSNVEALINLQNRNMAHVLKGLCKNITIKQGNLAKNVTCPDNITQEVFAPEDNASDSVSNPGNVKITEMEHDMSDNDDNAKRLEHSTTQHDEPIVETPYDSCSDKDDMDDFDDQQDFETEIKASTVQKSHQTYSSSVNSVCLNNLRNVSKNLTIKSLNPSTLDQKESSKTVQTQEHFVTTQRKQLPMRINKQPIKELQNNNASKNSKDSSQFADMPTNSLHQKVSAMNQVNTINKEVTVKTFQTKTVIQEITTTVTKTIKTVNQTVKQELRTNYQTNGPMIPQKVLGIRPNQTKNLQGIVVRHAAPIGIRANNTMTQIRPTGTVVRPCKQNVPMRTGMNSPRPNNPRMAVGKQVTTPPNPSILNKPVGKSIKISPTAMISGTTKRPTTEDVSGPFSCFKKPKESLIPVSDIPTFSNSGESPAHFTSASHTSSSNITNTKIVKGNTVVTAKQVKSQMNASNQQYSRVNNNSGLKIMSSQAKQTQVQEKSESSAMKRTTLEAIQRLQKQGLLVKKPRTDMNESSRSSNHESDDSTEETDE